MVLIKQNHAAVFNRILFFCIEDALMQMARDRRQNISRKWSFGAVYSSTLPHSAVVLLLYKIYFIFTGQYNFKTLRCRVENGGLNWCSVRVIHLQGPLESLGMAYAAPGHMLLVFSFVVVAKGALGWFLVRYQSSTEQECN